MFDVTFDVNISNLDSDVYSLQEVELLMFVFK